MLNLLYYLIKQVHLPNVTRLFSIDYLQEDLHTIHQYNGWTIALFNLILRFQQPLLNPKSSANIVIRKLNLLKMIEDSFDIENLKASTERQKLGVKTPLLYNRP